MKTTILPALFLCALAFVAAAQPKQTPLDEYLETADTILVVKCLDVGAVNILLQADVTVQVLLVVKGTETLRELSLRSQYGLKPGKRYLLRLEGDVSKPTRRYFARGRNDVIEVSDSEKIDELKTLSPRIIVLRTMNIRVDHLESDIRSLTYELDSIKAARRND